MANMIDHSAKDDPGAEKKAVIRVYAAMGVTMMLSLLPFVTAAIVCMIFLLGVMVSAYWIRRASDDGSLSENHMTYLIRTIWIGGFISIFTVIAGSAYMLLNIDNAPLSTCINDILNAGHISGAAPYSTEPYEMFMPCLAAFFETNKTILIVSAVITAGPVMVYFVYRYFNGLTRAIKGYRLANPKSWI